MAYVPPQLRNKGRSAAKAPKLPRKPPIPLRKNLVLDEINHHFWPVTEGQELDGLAKPFSDIYHGKTLHDSREMPGKLAYVILYFEANPRWENDKIIFTKSNLDLLPKPLADKAEDQADAGAEATNADSVATIGPNTNHESDGENAARPIAIFKQMTNRRRTSGYRFEGWYRIEHVAFLEPHSAELVRMLEQKWARIDVSGNTVLEQRRGTEWEKSLGYRWAVVQFSRDEMAGKERGPLKIKRLPGRGRRATNSNTPKKSVDEMPKKSVNKRSRKSVNKMRRKSVNKIPRKSVNKIPRKSVNELLAEMRLKESGGEKVDGEEAKLFNGDKEAATEK